MRKIWTSLILSLLPLVTFASVEFFALLPNPAGDDTLGEYIEIRNAGCASVDIGGYQLYDASHKTYTIPSVTNIGAHSNLTFPYSETKISLNNTGIETITLVDQVGVVIDTEMYSGTQRDNVVIYLSPVDENCEANTNTDTSSTGSQGDNSTGETNTGTTDAGDILTGTGASGSGNTESASEGTGTTSTGSSSTGATASGIINTGTGDTNPSNPHYQVGTGTTNTGITNTGTENQSPPNPNLQEGTGATNTGTTATGSIDANTGTTNTSSDSSLSGSSSTGYTLFPAIIPTRQEPTNATLSGNIWDCGTNQPCRVNVTFEPIFTGSFAAKNYLCEVITETGTLTTCNPNTLYFSTGGSFGFRLTLRSDMSQSRMVSWLVSFDATNTGATDTGMISTGSTNTGSSSGVIFPEIVPTYQNYTNLTHSGDILTCVTSPCRLNFTLEPIFTGSFVSNDYTCEVSYGTEVYTSCNPGQMYPIGTGSVDITLTHKLSGEKSKKSLQIVQNISLSTPVSSPTIDPIVTTKDTNPPIAIIEFDGKMHDYYEQINDYEFNCYTMTCSVNLTGERSYDPEGSEVRFLWIYGPNEIKTSRDPGGRKYGIGDHEIMIRVIDTSENYSQIRYRIHVLGPKLDKEMKTKKKESKKGADETNIGEENQNQTKISEMSFFDPPEIILQDSKFVPDGDGYICRTKNKTCSINLVLSGTQNNIVYSWDYGDGTVFHSKNPRSHSYDTGDHVIHLTAGYDIDTPIWSRDIGISVEKIATTRKPKKSKIVSPKNEQILSENDKTTEENPIKIVSAESTETELPYTTMAFVSSVIPLILVRRYIIGA